MPILRYAIASAIAAATLAGPGLAGVPGSCPADLGQLTAGHWCVVPDSRLEDASTEEDVDVIKPWSGGIFDGQEQRLVVWGGGHTDYSGNELYAFDVVAQTWQQLTLPSTRLSSGNDAYPDGRPASRHTYNGLVYLPDRHALWSHGGSLWSNGSCAGGAWIYDFGTVPPEDGWLNLPDASAGCEDVSAYDPVTGRVWFWSRQDLLEFDPSDLADPWTVRGDGRPSGTPTAALDVDRHELMVIGVLRDPPFRIAARIDLDAAGSLAAVDLSTTGATEIEEAKGPGFVYHPPSRRFVAWSGQPDEGLDPADVFVFDPPTLHWTRLAPAPGNPIVPTPAAAAEFTTGTYGRFQWVPALDVFVLVNAVDENVFFYRLPISSLIFGDGFESGDTSAWSAR